MNPDPRLDDLLTRWEEARLAGSPVAPEELCRACPELLAELVRQIGVLRRMERLLEEAATLTDTPPARQTGSTDLSPTLPPGGIGTDEVPAVPGYEVVALLGRGGMGVVYRARQHHLDRDVALKMILAGAHAGEAERARFLAEARAVADIRHPGIVGVYEFGSHAGLPYFAQEYCPGGNLADRLARGPLPAAEAAALIQSLARAVQAAHQRGIVHRDLKPQNVLLDAGGAAKVADFGLAKFAGEALPHHLTRSGQIFGTPSYMAPEQARGDSARVGPAADVYALGAILYECLTGRPPFRADSAFETILQVLHDEPVRPRRRRTGVPRDLETVCLKCLHKEPERRYASASELADDLGRFLAGEPVLARRVGTAERVWMWVKRRPLPAALAAAALLALVGGAATSTVFGLKAVEEAGRAKENERQAKAALEEERRATAAGHLRPLGHDSRSTPVNQFERDSLERLATLPRSRDQVRVLFIELGLEHAGTAGQLDRRLGPALHAAVGLDDGRRRQILEVVRQRLAEPGEPRVVAARIAAALVVEEADLARQAGDALLAALGEDEDVYPDLLRLADRVTPADAEALARAAVDQAMQTTSEPLLGSLARVVAALIRPLPDARAGPLAARVAQRLAEVADPDHPRSVPRRRETVRKLPDAEPDRAGEKVEVLVLPTYGPLGPGLAALAGRIPPADAQRLGAHLRRRASRTTQPAERQFLATALAALHRRLPRDEVAPTARLLLDRAVGFDARRRLLVELAECLPRHEVQRRAGTLARPLVFGAPPPPRRHIEPEENLPDQKAMPVPRPASASGPELTRLLDLAGPACARSLAADLAALLCEQSGPPRLERVALWVRLVTALPAAETSDDATALGQFLLRAAERSPRELLAHVEAFLGLAERLPAGEARRQAAEFVVLLLGQAAELLRLSGAGLADGPDALVEADRLAGKLNRLLALLPDDEADAQATRLAQELTAQAAQTSDPHQLAMLAQTFRLATARLPAGAVTAQARRINRAIRDHLRRSPRRGGELALALAALAGEPPSRQLPRADAEATVAILVRLLLRPANETDGDRLVETALGRLVPYLGGEAADAVADWLLWRLAPEEGNPPTREALHFRTQATLFSRVADRQPAERARQGAARIVGRIERNAGRAHPMVLRPLSEALTAVSRHAPADQARDCATRLTRAVGEHAAQTQEPSDLAALAGVVESLAPHAPVVVVNAVAADLARRLVRHGDAEDGGAPPPWRFLIGQLSDQQALDLLKHPLCAAPPRAVVLTRLLGAAPAREKSFWDVRARLVERHPGLDLASVPSILRSTPRPGRASMRPEEPPPTEASSPMISD